MGSPRRPGVLDRLVQYGVRTGRTRRLGEKHRFSRPCFGYKSPLGRSGQVCWLPGGSQMHCSRGTRPTHRVGHEEEGSVERGLGRPAFRSGRDTCPQRLPGGLFRGPSRMVSAMRGVALGIGCLLMGLSACALPQPMDPADRAWNRDADLPQVAESPFGRTYQGLTLGDEAAAAAEENLALAWQRHETFPNSEDAVVWVGRRLAYLGRYHDAIAVFSHGLDEFPGSPQLLRHPRTPAHHLVRDRRGHRRSAPRRGPCRRSRRHHRGRRATQRRRHPARHAEVEHLVPPRPGLLAAGRVGSCAPRLRSAARTSAASTTTCSLPRRTGST